MAGVALGLTNVVLGLGNIGAGIGFGVAEQNKMDELTSKSNKLKDAATTAGNLYDHVYYLVAVNLDRGKKALDKLPSDMLEKVEKQITSDLSDSKAEEAIKTMAKVLGYTGAGVGVLASLAQVAVYFRNRKAKGEEPTEPPEEPFENVPLDGEAPPVVPEGESSLPQTPKLNKLLNGLNIAGIVFGVAGLATTIGLGVWTLDKLDKAISDVEKKQTQVDAFQKALTDALDAVVKAAGLQEKDYNSLTTMAATWKKISEGFDSYEKSMYYAIRGYFMKKSYDEIKAMVDKESDEGKPFPEDGYPLAKTLADDINYEFEQKKTDKEVVAYFATEDPKIGLRFVFDEFFISSLRWI